MKMLIASLFAALTLSACAVTGTALGPTPESQIVNGANSITAAATLGTVLLRNDRITAAQAKSYRAILGTADAHLKDADKTLLACRAKTGSTAETVPDPCAAGIGADINLALSIAADVKKTLDSKGN